MVSDNELVETARKAKEKAYAPYSGFKVGAAVLTENGNVYTGVNIENASYGATNCAERTAIFKAVSEGETRIKKVAVIGDSESIVHPCGMCRQVMAEFADGNMRIICSNKYGNYKVFSLDEMLPNSFNQKTLK